MSENRIEYLDWIKGTSMILVIFCHHPIFGNETIIGSIVMMIVYGAVPCFMMCSGGGYHRSKGHFSWVDYVRKMQRVYMVMVAWKVIYLVVYYMLYHISFSKADLIQYLFFFASISGVDDGIMWFIQALLCSLLLYPVSYFLMESKQSKLVLFLACVAAFSGIILPTIKWMEEELTLIIERQIPSMQQIKVIMPLNNYGHMIFYFFTGALLFEKRREIKDKISDKKYISLFIFLVGLVGLLGTKGIATGSLRWNGIHPPVGYMNIFVVCIAIGMYLVFMKSRSNKILKILSHYIGKNTLGIFYIHFLLLELCKVYIYPYIESYQSFSLNCLKTILITLASAILTIALKKLPIVKYLVQ